MIKFRNVGFKYESNTYHSIKNVSFDVEAGECIVLAGRSGCGKSTITHCISGLIPHYFEGTYTGDVLIDDVSVSNSPIHKISEKVGSVFQDPRSQFFTLDTRSELAFTCENFGIKADKINLKMNEISSVLNIESIMDRQLLTLSSGEKQKVAIASVLMLTPQVLVMDEPSANLDFASVHLLKCALEKLKASGYTLIISEHRFYYLMDVLDRVLLLNKGSLEKIWEKDHFSKIPSDMLNDIGLRVMRLDSLRKVLKTNKASMNKVLQVHALGYRYDFKKWILRDVNFSLYKGDVVALVGKNGAGKTTLARLLSGLRKEIEGEIKFTQVSQQFDDRRNRTTFVMQDADYQLFADSVYQELVLGNEALDNIDLRIDKALEVMNLADMKEAHPATLSGGEKQRITISMAMIKEASLIIMDEPTSGLDRTNMERVCKMVQYFSKMGKAVLLITHDYEFIVNSCSRALYLKSGSIAEKIDLTLSTDRLLSCFDEMKRV